MTRSHHTPYLFGILMASVLALAGCGGGGNGNTLGGGGCGGGAEVTGVAVCVDLVQPYYQKSDNLTNQIDLIQDSTACTAPQIEYFSDHFANVTLSARLVQGATQPPASTSVVFTHYTVDYTPIPSPGTSSPGIAALGPIYETMTVSVPSTPGTAGTVTRGLTLMTLRQKAVFLTDLGLGGAWDGVQRNYSVTYTFYGQDQHGNSVVARGFTQVLVGSYVYPCV